MILMSKDTPVMRLDIDEGVYDIYDHSLLPYQLRGKLKPLPEITGKDPRKEALVLANVLAKNREAVIDYLGSRILPLTRENAKKIYQYFRFEQAQDIASKAKIALVCRAVSLQDDYWVRDERDTTRWKDIDLRNVHLNEVVTQLALTGSSLTLNGKKDIHTPELTGQGAYAKAWVREDKGLYLHKKGSDAYDTESHVEVMVSHLLDKMNVEHVRYEDGWFQDDYTCRCRLMTTKDISILPGMDFVSYEMRRGNDPDKEMIMIDKDSYYKMQIVDYLIANRDRHGMNWGFFYDAKTMDIIGMHPLYDHNNAFDKDFMTEKDSEYVFNGKSLRESAMDAMRHVDLHFTKEITREDFMTKRQYDCFMDRAEELGIKVKVTDLDLLHYKVDAAIALGDYDRVKNMYLSIENEDDRKDIKKHILTVSPEQYPLIKELDKELEEEKALE